MVQGIPDHIKGGEKAYTDEDVRMMLDKTQDSRSKALIHFMVSLGVRSGLIVDPILTFGMIEPMPQDVLQYISMRILMNIIGDF